MTLDQIINTGSAVRGHPVQSIVCKDGFSISVQAHARGYCLPRDNIGPYVAVECGFPSGPVTPEMMAFIERGWTEPTESVFAYVPVAIVRELIAMHGGEAT